MGNYDRTHNQWRMMQQRHSSSLNNPYFSGGYIAGNSDRRASGLQPLCNPNTTSNNNNDAASAATNYYTMGGDDRTAPHKRSRLTVNTSAAGLRANDYSKMNRGDSPNSGGGGMDTPRLAGLVSYLSPSAESLSQYSYQHQGVDGYGGPGPSGVPSAIGSSGQEMNSDWFAQRGLSSSMGVSAAPVNSYTTSSEMASVSGTGLSRQSSLASPTTIFGMENLMADYESGFYSLWNQPNGGNVMGYDADAPSDRQPSNVETGHVYMPEEELKMDYPQLPDLNQGDLDYIYGSMDTPTATRGGEPPMDRSYGSSVKRDRPSDDNKTFTGMMSPSQSGLLSPLALSGFRNLARNTTIETKRPAAARSHASSSSYLGAGGPSATSKPTSSPHLTAKKAHTPTTPGSASSPSPSSSKRPRSRQCDFPGCDNRARSHQKCKKHGGAHQCMFEGCLKNSQSRGLCIAHGGGSRCKVDGCTRAAQSKGLCKSHGGGEFCAVEGCRKKAHLKHLCRTHGGGVRCKDTKCMKWAQRKGWCMAHAKLVLDP